MKHKTLVLSILMLLSFPMSHQSKGQALRAESSSNINGLGYGINAVTSDDISSENILVGSCIFDREWLQTQIDIAKNNKINTIYTDTTYETGKSFNDISKKITSNFKFNLNATLGIPLFSPNASIGFKMDSDENYLYNASQYYYRFHSLIVKESYALPDYTSNLNEYKKHLNPYFLLALEAVFSNHGTFAEIFNKFGTHIIARAEYGGKTNLFYNVFSNQIDVGGELASKLDAKVKDGIKATASFDIREITEEKTGEYIEKLNLKAYGGNTFSIVQMSDFYDKYTSWCNSLDNPNNLVLVNTTPDGLIPLWNFLPDEFDTYENRQNMMEAYEEYAITNTIDTSKYNASPLIYNSTFDNDKLPVRQREFTITDENDLNKQPHDIIDLNTYCYYGPRVLRTHGYKTIIITISLDMKEVDSGYQEFYIYNGPEMTSSNLLFQKNNYEYGGSNKKTTYGKVSFSQSLMLSEIQYPTLYIRYGAHGSGRDNWMNKNLYVTIQYAK